MQIVIPVTGSRGDVQPYIALGKGLLTAGHDVRLATHTDFADLVRAQGLEFYPLAPDARAFHETKVGKRMLAAGTNPFVYLREFVRLREPWTQSLMAHCDDACRDADLVVLARTAFFVGYSVAEKRGLRSCSTSLQPINPSRYLANCMVPDAPNWLPGRQVYNFGSAAVIGEYVWQQLRPMLNRARRDVLGLPPLPFLGMSMTFLRNLPTLYGYSSWVVRRPLDWDDNQHVTGFWFLDAAKDYRPPADLEAFLDAGESPVCIGFGSMLNQRPEAVTDLVVRAVERAGLRALLLTGWGGLGRARVSDRVFVTDAVPHDWLFPRMAAVVHHGGAGTTSAGLRAGVPSMAVPFAGDQFFWGRRLFSLGVGARPIPLAELSVERLTGALRLMARDEGIRVRAAELGQRIRDEDGVGQAVAIFERCLGSAGQPNRVRVPFALSSQRGRRLVLQEGAAGR